MTACDIDQAARLWTARQDARRSLAAWRRDPMGDPIRGYELAIGCLRADLEYREYRRRIDAGHGRQFAGHYGLLPHARGRGDARDPDGRRLDLHPVLPEPRQGSRAAAPAALAVPGHGAEDGGTRGHRGGRD
jgi:hypothetical protein